MKTVLTIATLIISLALTSCGSKRFGSDCGYTNITPKNQVKKINKIADTKSAKELKTIS